MTKDRLPTNRIDRRIEAKPTRLTYQEYVKSLTELPTETLSKRWRTHQSHKQLERNEMLRGITISLASIPVIELASSQVDISPYISDPLALSVFAMGLYFTVAALDQYRNANRHLKVIETEFQNRGITPNSRRQSK